MTLFKRKRYASIAQGALGFVLVLAFSSCKRLPDPLPIEETASAFATGESVRLIGPGGNLTLIVEFKFYDGTRATWANSPNTTPEAAESQLQALLAGDQEVLERGPLYSSQSVEHGERLIVKYHPFGRDREPYFMLWKLRGNQLDRVESLSMDCILTIEREVKYLRD
jgi:hypothetical protein